MPMTINSLRQNRNRKYNSNMAAVCFQEIEVVISPPWIEISIGNLKCKDFDVLQQVPSRLRPEVQGEHEKYPPATFVDIQQCVQIFARKFTKLLNN